MFDNKRMSPGGTSGGNFGNEGTNGAGNQQDPDYKKLYEELLKKSEKLIDPSDYDVSKDKRYTGLMQTLQKTQDDKKAIADQFDDLQTQFKTVKSEHESATQSVSTLQSQIDALEIEKETLSVKSARADLIMKEFPQLAGFEADGLLPETGPDEGEEALKKLFTSFSAKLGSVKEQAKTDFGKGGLPGSAGAGGENNTNKTATAKVEYDLAVAASLKGDQTEYRKHYDNYLNLSKPTGQA
jgi:DNA repair exonuclease SbcCD ATPase subunit